MGWFQTRWSTVLDAITAKRVVWIGTVFAVFSFVLHFAPRLKFGTSPLILGTPPWAWASIAALSVVIYFVFEYAHRKRMETVALFELSFDQNAGCIVHTPTVVYHTRDGRTEGIRSNGAYLRIRTDNISKVTIRDCFAFVTSIAKSDHSGTFKAIPLSYPIALQPQPFTAYPVIPHFSDFLKVGELENNPEIAGPWPFTLQDSFREPGVYRFGISVNAGGITKAINVDVTWPGVWNKISGKPA